MLGLDVRVGRAAWTVFLVSLLLAVTYLLRRVLLIFVVALLFAYLLTPLVNLVDRLRPRRFSRNWALAAVYIALLAVLVLLGSAVGAQVGREAAELAKRLPALIERIQQALAAPGPAWLEPVRQQLLELLKERAPGLASGVLPLIQGITSRIVSILSGALAVILIPILAFFFLKDGPALRAAVLGAMSPERRAVFDDIFADLHHLLGQFMRALVLLALATLVFYGTFFALMGTPYALLLASVAAVLEFIPMVGPLTAAAIIVLVAAFQGLTHVLIILGFLSGYRLFQDYVLAPRLMSASVALHPLLVIFGALGGGELAGVWGVFLSVPVLATLRVVYLRVRKAAATGVSGGSLAGPGC